VGGGIRAGYVISKARSAGNANLDRATTRRTNQSAKLKDAFSHVNPPSVEMSLATMCQAHLMAA